MQNSEIGSTFLCEEVSLETNLKQHNGEKSVVDDVFAKLVIFIDRYHPHMIIKDRTKHASCNSVKLVCLFSFCCLHPGLPCLFVQVWRAG